MPKNSVSTLKISIFLTIDIYFGILPTIKIDIRPILRLFYVIFNEFLARLNIEIIFPDSYLVITKI